MSKFLIMYLPAGAIFLSNNGLTKPAASYGCYFDNHYGRYYIKLTHWLI